MEVTVVVEAYVLLRAAYAYEVEQRTEEDQDRDPVVDPHAEDLVGLVDAQCLDPEPAHAVRHDVEGERPALAELPPPIDEPDQERDAEVPHQLIEEGRVERPACHLDRVAVRVAIGLAG